MKVSYNIFGSREILDHLIKLNQVPEYLTGCFEQIRSSKDLETFSLASNVSSLLMQPQQEQDTNIIPYIKGDNLIIVTARGISFLDYFRKVVSDVEYFKLNSGIYPLDISNINVILERPQNTGLAEHEINQIRADVIRAVLVRYPGVRIFVTEVSNLNEYRAFPDNVVISTPLPVWCGIRGERLDHNLNFDSYIPWGHSSGKINDLDLVAKNIKALEKWSKFGTLSQEDFV